MAICPTSGELARKEYAAELVPSETVRRREAASKAFSGQALPSGENCERKLQNDVFLSVIFTLMALSLYSNTIN